MVRLIFGLEEHFLSLGLDFPKDDLCLIFGGLDPFVRKLACLIELYLRR